MLAPTEGLMDWKLNSWNEGHNVLQRRDVRLVSNFVYGTKTDEE